MLSGVFSYPCCVVDSGFAVGKDADGPRGQVVLRVSEGDFRGERRVEVGENRGAGPGLGPVDMNLRFVTSKS